MVDFQERLQCSEHMLTLEALNWVDMENYAIDKLSAVSTNAVMKRHFQWPMTVSGMDFVSRLVSRAEGVFLWACLVLKRLTSRIRVVQDIEKLHEQLDTFPSELGAYFKKLMYERINPTWTDNSETAATLVVAQYQYGWSFFHYLGFTN